MISGFRHKADRNVLFRVITQRVVVISYRRFGTTHQFHLQGSRISFKVYSILFSVLSEYMHKT